MKWVDGWIALLATTSVAVWLKTPGFLFLLDYVTGPIPPPIRLDATGAISGISVQLLSYMLASIFPPEAVTKLLILIALLIAGISTAHLCKQTSRSKIVAFSCGVFIMLNPFVFNRIFMGHIYLLFGYALMPLLLLMILRYLQLPSRTRAAWVGALSLLIMLTSIHHIILLPLAALFFVLQYRTQFPKKVTASEITIMLAPPIIAFIAILLIALGTSEWTGRTLQQVSPSLFALQPYCTQSTIWDTVTLSANWRTPTITTFPCMMTPLVGIASGALLMASVIGISSGWIGILYVASILLALGVSFIPGWNPMRDSGKFLETAIFAQALLLASAAFTIRKQWLSKIFSYVLLVCVLIIAGSTVQALKRSIAPAPYPALWYEWNTTFAEEVEKPRVLVLPWHQYMAFDFTNQLSVANPAPIFFTNADIISGDNIEIARNDIAVPSISQNPLSKEIESILSTKDPSDFHSRLENLVLREGISYILMTHSDEHEAWLREQLSSAPFVTEQHSDATLRAWKVVQTTNQ
jgi:hypothetical protein